MSKIRPRTAAGRLVGVLLFCAAAVWVLQACSPPSAGGEVTWAPTTSSRLLAVLRRHLDQGSLGAASITSPVAAHGWVNKTGLLDPLHWHDSSSKQRREVFNSWFSRWRASQRHRDKMGDAWLPDPPRAIAPACQVFVNHRYKFIYLRQRKTGSMSVVHHLTQCDDASPGPACLEVLDSSTPLDRLERLWAEYFVFTVVRNPFKRALSSYKFLLSRMHAEPASCTEGLGWPAFCGDPMALGQRCREQPDCCFGSAGMFWAHTVEQARCMLAGDAVGGGEGGHGDGGGWAVDYIGRTERMDEDVAEILAEIDRRRPPGAPALRDNATDSDGGGDSNSSSSSSSGESGSSSSGPAHINHVLSCDPAGGRLVPRTKLSADGPYLAAVPQEQYCDDWEYFSGEHAGCMHTLRHFLQRDFALLYPGGLAAPSSRRRQTERAAGGGGGSTGPGVGLSAPSSDGSEPAAAS